MVATTDAAPTLEQASDFIWLINDLAAEPPGVEHAERLSSDGLCLTASHGLTREHADQLAAMVSGMQSLAEGTSQMLAKGSSDQLIVRMSSRSLLVIPISDGSCLAVLTTLRAELKIVSHQLPRLVESADHALTPKIRAELLTTDHQQKV